jgi:hypothetical protein
MNLFGKRGMRNDETRGRLRGGHFRLTRHGLPVVCAVSMALSLALSSCESTASSSQSTLVRIIHASNYASGVNFFVRGTEIAANIGEGTVSEYGTLTPSTVAASVVVKTVPATSTTSSTTLATASTPLLTGQHYSVLLSDNGSSSSTTYTLTVLKDQRTSSASGTSTFRFINEATNTGAVDIYVVPSSSTLSGTNALFTDLASGSSTSYTSFTSQTVTLVITPTGSTSTKYTSSSLALTGGEVRTVVIVDNKLTSNPPVSAIIADDAD